MVLGAVSNVSATWEGVSGIIGLLMSGVKLQPPTERLYHKRSPGGKKQGKKRRSGKIGISVLE